MRKVANYPLWIGNPGDLRDPRPVLDAGIEAIVELADNEEFANLPRDLIRCRFPLSDGGDNPAWLLQLAVECVARFLRNDVAVIACCSGGMNRSVCISAAAIALVRDCPLNDALLDVIGDGPADVSPRLLQQVQKAMK